MKEIKKIFLTARYTFVEIYKSKVMLSVVILGIALLIVSYVASELSYGVPARIAFDFGFGALTFSSVGMAIFIGVTLVSREIENRTVYMTISRPIKRSSFLLGKILGLAFILLVNILILSVLTLGLYLFLGGEFNELFSWMILFAFFESLLTMLIVIFFSLFNNITMSVVYTLAFYISGHAISDLQMLSFVKENPLFKNSLSLYSWGFPNFSKINIKNFAIYKQTLELDFLLGASLYACVYALMLLLISAYIFEKKNLD